MAAERAFSGIDRRGLPADLGEQHQRGQEAAGGKSRNSDKKGIELHETRRCRHMDHHGRGVLAAPALAAL
jgi:hypothetical protein